MTTLKHLKEEHSEIDEGIMSAIKKVAVPVIAGAALAAGASHIVKANPADTIAHSKTVAAHQQQAADSTSGKAKLADMRARMAAKQAAKKPL